MLTLFARLIFARSDDHGFGSFWGTCSDYHDTKTFVTVNFIADLPCLAPPFLGCPEGLQEVSRRCPETKPDPDTEGITQMMGLIGSVRNEPVFWAKRFEVQPWPGWYVKQVDVFCPLGVAKAMEIVWAHNDDASDSSSMQVRLC